MPDIIFGNQDNPIVTDTVIIHDTDTFLVQWSALNISGSAIDPFVDRLVITSIPEGCPGTDGAEHPVVFDESFDEPSLTPGQTGSLQQPSVGPFPVGAYRLTVTLAEGLGTGHTTFACIDIVAAV